MKFDDILKALGEFGPYQRRIYFLICLPAIGCALHKLVWVFVGAIPKYRCRLLLDELSNGTLPYSLPYQVLNLTIPWDDKNNKWDCCHRYKISLNTTFNLNDWDTFGQDVVTSRESEKCHEWVYDVSQYKTSVVSDFNLVCDNNWLRALVQSLFMLGEFMGSLVWGSISDRYGRKIVFFISLIMQATFGILSGLVADYYIYLLLRGLVGLFTPGVFLVAFVIGMELVGPSKRSITGIGCQFFFAMGYLLTAGVAFFIREWQYLQIAVSVPGLVFVVYWWIIPESIRWLLTKRRFDEAKVLLKEVARVNGTTFPEDFEQFQLEPTVKQETNPLSLFKYPNLRKKSLILFLGWFVNSGVYYGLALNTSNLGGNDYVNFVIAALTEFPAYTFCILALNKLGRRLPLCGSMLIGGISMLITGLVPADNYIAIVTLAMIGKLGITISYAIIYIFAAEQYPTVVRNVGMGMSSTCARLGGVLAPFIILLADYWRPLPLLIFGAESVIVGLLTLLLPETRGVSLPDTLADGENFGKKEVIS